MSAKIYRPAKTAMQSGKAKTHLWILEFDQDVPRTIDPMMGYTSSAYAERNGIDYRVIAPKDATRKAVSYSDNFRYNRLQPWTH